MDHPLVPAGEPTLRPADDPATDRMWQQLRAAPAVAYDSEFIGEQTYHPRTCLVQLGTAEALWLIDPLTAADAPDRRPPSDPVDMDPLPPALSPLWDLLADPEVTKLVHAGEQDLEPAVRATGKPPVNVVDVQIVAGFVGMRYPISLDGLVEHVLGASLGHTAKFSRWDRRPLTTRQQRYAADDVRYLPAVWDNLQTMLDASGNAEHAMAACRQACERIGRGTQTTPALRARGVGRLPPQARAVLDALQVWRDELAQRIDAPPRSVLADPVVMALAQEVPVDEDQLQGIKGLPRPVRQQHGRSLCEAVQRALDGPMPTSRGRIKPPTSKERDVVAERWQQVQDHLEARQIATGVVTSKRYVESAVLCGLRGQPLPEDHPLSVGWRRDLVGGVLELG